jgi:hypothetical protein
MDCYGGMSEAGQGFVSTCIRLQTSQHNGWERRGVEASAWQGLGMALMRELARQLAWGQCPEQLLDCSSAGTHSPYF